MKITVDTHVLVRLIMADDEAQNSIAVETVEKASLVVISVHSLCELTFRSDKRIDQLLVFQTACSRFRWDVLYILR